MKILDDIKGFFARKKTYTAEEVDNMIGNLSFRGLAGMLPSRMSTWPTLSFSKPDEAVIDGLIRTVAKCRDLSMNNAIVKAWIQMMQKSIIGVNGFELQVQTKANGDSLNDQLNDAIEWEWFEFGKTSNGFITPDGMMGHQELDTLILKRLLIDGECFIRIHRDAPNPYRLTFEILDSMSIDWTKRREGLVTGQNSIILGVEVDKYGRPVNYYYKPGTSTVYLAGQEEIIPASDIIHLYDREYLTTRGVPPLNAVIGKLKQLDEYADAELNAAKQSAALTAFAEPQADTNPRGSMNQWKKLPNGDTIGELTPGTIIKTPVGYTVKLPTPNHPVDCYDDFQRAIIRHLASSLGVSYNKMMKDYENVSFSSLREGTIDESAYYSSMQQWLIRNWKEKEFDLFLKALAVKPESKMKPSAVKDVSMHHTWIPWKRPYFDPAKEVLTTERELKLGLKSPLMVMEQEGLDPEEVMKSWSLYEALCEKYGVSFNVKDEDPQVLANEDYDEESTKKEAMNKARD